MAARQSIPDVTIHGKLPPYILKRNERALRAGLELQQLRLTRSGLRACFIGTVEQFVAAGFVSEPAKLVDMLTSGTKAFSCAYRVLSYFSASRNPPLPRLFREPNGRARVTITAEPVPHRWWEAAPGVSAFEFGDNTPRFGHGEVYVSHKVGDLLKLGVVDVDTIEKALRLRHANLGLKIPSGEISEILSAEEDLRLWEFCQVGGESLPLWEMEREGDIFFLRRWPKNLPRADRAKEMKRRWDVENMEAYRLLLEEGFNAAENILTTYIDIRSRQGFRYVFSERSKQELRDKILEVQMAIERAKIEVYRLDDRTHEEKEASRRSVDVAETDRNFQRFLRRVFDPRPPAGLNEGAD